MPDKTKEPMTNSTVAKFRKPLHVGFTVRYEERPLETFAKRPLFAPSVIRKCSFTIE